MNSIRISALLIFLMLLAGCSSAAPSAAPKTSTLPAAVTQPPAPSATQAPSATPWPTATPLPSATPTATQLPTVTPDPALAAVRLLGVSWLANYDLLLSIEFSGPVTPEQYKVIVEDKTYACQAIANQPMRLVCIGQGMNVYDRVTVRIFPAGSDQPGFEGRISIPYFTN